MSTRAQISIRIGPEEWAHVYVHYDGYPQHMLPALAPWTPEDILAAKEIRQVRADELDCFDPPRRSFTVEGAVKAESAKDSLRYPLVQQRPSAGLDRKRDADPLLPFLT